MKCDTSLVKEVDESPSVVATRWSRSTKLFYAGPG